MMKVRKFYNAYLPILTHYINVPYMDNEPRRIRVLLPRNYEQNSEKVYPVLYMHDGQNVFYSRESFSGYSWKLIPLMKNQNFIPEMIVVAIDNSGENRFDEYTPWEMTEEEQQASGHTGGLGMEYAEWIVSTVKPFIDTTYRTLPEREHTLLAGSSLGGLITAYMGSAYPDVFGNLGIFSLCSWVSEEAFLDYIGEHPVHPEAKVYIQVGTVEGNSEDAGLTSRNVNQAYIDSSLWYYQTLLENGHSLYRFWFRILADEGHFEKYWADHFEEFLAFSFSD